MIVVYKEPNKDNKIEVTKEELESLLEQARQEGYNEGYQAGLKSYPVYPPYTWPTTSPSTPTDPWKITWMSNAANSNINYKGKPEGLEKYYTTAYTKCSRCGKMCPGTADNYQCECGWGCGHSHNKSIDSSNVRIEGDLN